MPLSHLHQTPSYVSSLASILLERLIRIRKRQRITLVWNNTHQLPVVYRRQYNFLVCAYKVLYETVSQYLEQRIVAYRPTVSLRSDKRCLEKAATTLSNSLPLNIRKCKSLDAFKKMKTNVFTLAFLS